MIRRISAVLFLLFVSASAFAQKEVIVLKNSMIRMSDQKFYIKSVIDGRGHTSDIGYVHKGSFNKKEHVELQGGLEKALTDFYTYAVTPDTSLIPIVIRVVFLQVSERTDGPSEIGKAELKVEFYKPNAEGKWGKVFETEAQTEEVAPDVTSGHERRLRKVLESVILSFNNSNWKTVQPEFIEYAEIRGQKSILLNNALVPEKKTWTSLIQAHAAFGSNAEGWGLSYLGVSSVMKGSWAFPISVAMDKYVIDPGLILRNGYETAKLNYGKIGLGAMKKIGGDFHFLFNVNIPLGVEELVRKNQVGSAITYTETTNFIYGVEPTQSFYFMTRSRIGFYLGAGLYERFFKSEVYKSDLGLKIEAGLKF
ncbi:MAG TPA: hypothetical protein PL185_13750 [Flavobacteriales bacterium]|nr:hypothetical protein [Flavobacteriales bacterium]HPH83637.1 hypothetical protein [Flavobacteriales bacterium]